MWLVMLGGIRFVWYVSSWFFIPISFMYGSPIVSAWRRCAYFILSFWFSDLLMTARRSPCFPGVVVCFEDVPHFWGVLYFVMVALCCLSGVRMAVHAVVSVFSFFMVSVSNHVLGMFCILQPDDKEGNCTVHVTASATLTLVVTRGCMWTRSARDTP